MPKHLPVLQSSGPPEGPSEPSLPGWTGAGVLITLLLWLLLGWIAQALMARSPGQHGWVWVLGPPISAFLIAAAGGGAFLAAFGPKRSSRPAIASGALSAAFAWVAAMLRSPWQQSLPVLVAATLIGAAASWAGWQVFRRIRGRRLPA